MHMFNVTEDVNVSNIVDFMTKKLIFRKETNIFQ